MADLKTLVTQVVAVVVEEFHLMPGSSNNKLLMDLETGQVLE